MKYFEFDLKGNTIKLRLLATDSVAIEKRTGKAFFDLMQDYSITNIIMILMYLRRSDDKTYRDEEAYKLYDELVDEGYTTERIMFDIIYPALVVSGFLDQKSLDEVKETKLEIKEKNKKKILAE